MLSEIVSVLADKQHDKLLVKVMATPNKQRTKLKKIVRSEQHHNILWILYVDIAAQPERGEANKELCTFMARLFSEHTVSIVSGQVSREKYFLIT